MAAVLLKATKIRSPRHTTDGQMDRPGTKLGKKQAVTRSRVLLAFFFLRGLVGWEPTSAHETLIGSHDQLASASVQLIASGCYVPVCATFIPLHNNSTGNLDNRNGIQMI